MLECVQICHSGRLEEKISHIKETEFQYFLDVGQFLHFIPCPAFPYFCSVVHQGRKKKFISDTEAEQQSFYFSNYHLDLKPWTYPQSYHLYWHNHKVKQTLDMSLISKLPSSQLTTSLFYPFPRAQFIYHIFPNHPCHLFLRLNYVSHALL